MLAVLVMAVVAVIVAIVTINLCAPRLVFHPPKFSVVSDEVFTIGEFPNEVEVLFHDVPHSEGVIVFSHGNACNIIQLAPELKELAEKTHMSVCAYEYPGYLNDNPTKASKCCHNLREVIRWLKTAKGYQDSNLILMGHSIGTGPTVQVASEIPSLNRVVLVSPYKSLPKVFLDSALANVLFPWVNMFPIEKIISNVRCPIIFVHGKRDKLIHYHHTEDLYAKRLSESDEVHLIENGDHGNMLEKVWEYI
jgi:pimeloyl-ACP methyl ester carboxylesterase